MVNLLKSTLAFAFDTIQYVFVDCSKEKANQNIILIFFYISIYSKLRDGLISENAENLFIFASLQLNGFKCTFKVLAMRRNFRSITKLACWLLESVGRLAITVYIRTLRNFLLFSFSTFRRCTEECLVVQGALHHVIEPVSGK